MKTSLQRQTRSVVKAAKTLVKRMDFIHDDKLYQSVWFSPHNHGIDYAKGPTYEKEFEALRKALKKLDGIK